MAKVGEGDPRWIVQQRDDGRNVNSWHWEERDLTKQVHEGLKAALTGKEVTEGGLVLTIDSVSDVEGDVTVAQRKGKIMCYFEVKLTAKWVVMVGETKIEGKLIAPEIEHDNFGEDFELRVSTVERSEAAAKAESVAQKGGRAAVRAAVKAFFEELFKQHHIGSKAGSAPPPATAAASPAPAKAPAPASAPAAPSGAPTSIAWTMDWRVPVAELFATLTDERRATGYTRAPAKIDPRPAGTFEFLGGAISGFYNEVEVNKRLTMQWRLGSWPSGHFSSVVISFSTEEAGMTRMEFAQAGIPAGEVDRVKQGWSVNFFDPIKMMMGYSMTWVNQ